MNAEDSSSLGSFSPLPISSTFKFTIIAMLLAAASWHRAHWNAVGPLGVRNLTVQKHALLHFNGLRGIAALLMFLRHHLSSFFPEGDMPKSDERFHRAIQPKWLIYIPILRLVHVGNFVPAFFLISGYVQTYTKIRHVNNGHLGLALRRLSASTFRRAFRLYLPTLVMAAQVTILAWLRTYENAYEYGQLWLSDLPTMLRQQPTFAAQVSMIWPSFLKTLNFWDWEFTIPHYNQPMWTIPSEFRCSMVLNLCLLGTATLKRPYRLLTWAFLILVSISWVKTDLCLFLVGALFAEIDLAETAPARHVHGHALVVRTIWVFVLVLGLALASGSEETVNENVMSRLIVRLTPPGWPAFLFMNSIGAVLVCRCCMISPYMRKVFERPVFLHLGNLSYSVYIIHVPFIQTIAVPVILLVCEDMLSGPNGAGLAVGFFVTTALIVLPLLLWLAGMFSTYVERPCTQFGQFVYEVAALEQIGIEH